MFGFITKKLARFVVRATALTMVLIAGFWIELPQFAHADGGADPDEFRFKKSSKKKKAKKSTIRRGKAKNKKAGSSTRRRAVRTSRNRQLLVTFPPNTPNSTVDGVAARFGLREIANSTNSLLNLRVFKFALKRNFSVTRLNQLISDPLVISAQPNFLYILTAKKARQYASKMLQIDKVHAISKGNGVTIAILDSGVFRDHPALKGVVAKQFDAVGKSGIRNTNHGTGIASIIVAHGKMVGIAPESRLLSARVFASDRRGGPLVAESFNLLRGLDWAVAEKAAVINMSFAGPKDKLFEEAVIAADKKEISMVAAVGNQGAKKPVAYPAAYGQVLAITATNKKHRIYRHANRGDQIFLAAPGVSIFVARRKRSFGLMTGTSAAAAHVSASIALMLQKKSNLNRTEIAASLIGVAKDLGRKGKDNVFGNGFLNVYGVVNVNQ